MITIFNRKNVYFGYDMNRSFLIRQILADNHIPYKFNTKNRMGQWAGSGTLRGRMGSFGQSTDTMYEYEIFVHEKDYDQAVFLISQADL